MVVIERTLLDGWARVFNRGVDALANCAGLIVLAPLSVAIRLTYCGPLFPGHNRLDRGGRPIWLRKFLTMRPELSTGPGYTKRMDAEIFTELGMAELAVEFANEQKLADDPRITRIGRFLRRTSLDELPQLFNFVKGDISLVGPRPILTAELVKRGPEQAKLLTRRPRPTALWRISGRNDVAYEDRVKLDIFDVENSSPLLDLRILSRTFGAVIRHSCAC
jgi:lipopolysaccharide/colanic/teichoic acid biosynthesis glycosyltransferase